MKKLIFSSLCFYWRNHLGVFVGTLLSVAILTGSLLVGDSVQGSLSTLALQRLGNVDEALFASSRFFSSSLADRVESEAGRKVNPVLMLKGMALKDDAQVNQIEVIGVDSEFWSFGSKSIKLEASDVAINQKLAKTLHLSIGDEISLRVERPSLLPREAPLSAQNKAKTARGRFVVKQILGANELGNFSLSANQSIPYNLFISKAWLEDRVKLPGKANLMIASAAKPNTERLDKVVRQVWKLSDFGFKLQAAGDLVQLSTERIYLGPEAKRAALAIPGAMGSLTYLVNSISKNGLSTPYSFIEAIDNVNDTEPKQSGENLIRVNRWVADELNAGVGDWLDLNYYALIEDNSFQEKERKLCISQIIEMDELSVEQSLAPSFPGLSDVDQCADWNAGFPMEEVKLADAANEVYWEKYRQLPKALVELSEGQSIWGNRFGDLTAVRWRGESEQRIQKHLLNSFDPALAGYSFRPVRTQALTAVKEAMDFGQLFVGMSFFLIVASLMLTGLLFVFGVESRSKQMGLLYAMGWNSSAIQNLFLAEGIFVALCGSLAGAGLGMVYTKLLLLGLRRYWTGAVANSSIFYYGSLQTLAIGGAVGFFCAVGAIVVAMHQQAGRSVRGLLSSHSDDFEKKVNESNPGNHIGIIIGVSTFFGALCLVFYALWGNLVQLTMPFFGAGALLLVSGISFCWVILNLVGVKDNLYSLRGLALRNAGRNRKRSLTVISLLASGCFMVFAVSSMKEDVTAHIEAPWSGAGGFSWFGQSTLPIYQDVGGVRLRFFEGDDASCLNLNHVRSPHLLSVDPDAMTQQKAFYKDENIWALLNTKLPDGSIPGLVGDIDTAMWGLKKRIGVERGDHLIYKDELGQQLKVKLVGQLPMRLSVFQGSVLISESNFMNHFPSEGYRVFLFNTPDTKSAATIMKTYSRSGLNVVSTADRLLEFYTVETTYLAMFLVLGVLGLLIGSWGMGVVVLRNMEDRIGEISTLRALGYRNADLRKMLFYENGGLLTVGLMVGSIASVVAMMPSVAFSGLSISLRFNGFLFLIVTASGFLCMITAVFLSMRGNPWRGLRNE